MHTLITRLAATALLALTLPASAVALETVKVSDNVYALVGELGQRSPQNLGNNSTHAFVITEAGVVLIDSGATQKGAVEIERSIRAVTPWPIIAVINTGGQDHRWLGNAYFKRAGARLIASAAAVADQRTRFDTQFLGLKTLVGDDNLAGTEPAYADETVETPRTVVLGGTAFELIPTEGAHTPGDMIVWLPDQRLAFAGDIVYVDRLLGLLPPSHSKKWLDAFAVLESLGPAVIVPGHGRPTDLATARRQTKDYLTLLRDHARRALDQGKDIEAVLKTDQSAFAHLASYDQLKNPNLQHVFIEMEFE